MNLSVQNLIRQPATSTQLDWDKETIRYGENDNFPLRLARLVKNSPTTSSCIDTKIGFIEGAGFSDERLADFKVNSQKQRFGDIHAYNAESYGIFEGFALNVKYNVEGLITEIYSVPFEHCRLGKPDDKGVITSIKVNPYFGTAEYRKTQTKSYDVYNPDPKVVLAQQAKQQKDYKGQILYIANTSPLSRFYPSPNYYSAENWMIVDEAIGGFHRHNIENGFFQSVLLRVIGDPNAPSTHPADQKWNEDTNQYEPDPTKTNAYRFNIEMQNFSGWNKAGNTLTLWGNKDEVPEIQAFPSTTNSELFRTLQDLTTEQIARATMVPSVLANIQSGASLGGDGNNIRASVKLMQQRVAKTQALLERVYTELLSHFKGASFAEVDIINYNPYPEKDQLDPLIWEALPQETKLAWIKKNTEFEIPDVVAPQPAAPSNFSNVFYADYPQKAKDNAKRALNFKTQMGSKCGGKNGWLMCQDIIDGKPLSYKSIRRIYNYLNKTESFQNYIFTDSCEAVLFHAWGGKEMLSWAKSKIDSINE